MSPWGESRGGPARGASSFSASPTANPAGRRKRNHLRPIRYRSSAVLLLMFSGLSSAMLAGMSPAPAAAAATTTSPTPTPAPIVTGGAGMGAPPTAPSTSTQPTVPSARAKIINGVAYAPAYAPIQVKQ